MAHIQLIGVSATKDPRGRIASFPYAFPIIIQQLRKTKHTFDHVDTHLDKLSTEELNERVDRMEAKIYGISAWSHNYCHLKDLTRRIRARHPDATIIVGGVLTGNDDVLMRHTETDIASTGAEGERILPEILDCLDAGGEGLPKVRGITVKNRAEGNWYRTEIRPVMSREEFQNVDMPAYDYFDAQIQEMITWLNSRNDVPVPAFPLLTMRGCPFPCTFCGHIYGRKFLRKKWETFFDEIHYLETRYGARGFYSQDTNMFLTRDEIDEYCRIYKERNCTFTICIELRTTFGDVDMFRQLYAHGVRVVLFGFESGSQRMLDLMRKGFEIDKMRPIIQAALEAGMFIHGNFIYGTPGENWQSMKETRKFQIEMDSWIHAQNVALGRPGTSGWGFTVLIPSPTSELYRIARERNLIPNEESYLISLSSGDNRQLLKGSNFKIKLADGDAGNINLSEFSSKDAMVACMRMNMALVKARMLIRGFGPKRVIPLTMALGRVVGQYARYLGFRLRDAVTGQRGVMPAALGLEARPRRGAKAEVGCGAA